MRETFVTINFTQDSLDLIQQANTIIGEYQRQGYRLSLRQLYYQFVSRDLIANNLKSYKRLGGIISEGRLGGLIDWDAIEDRGREYQLPNHWTTPEEIVRSAAESYRIDKWEGQPWHVEVMVEKDALSGVLEPVCRDLDIGFTANRGYSSSSAMYEAGKRIEQAIDDAGKDVLILYLGDHDPSGIDMTRDVLERLELFCRTSIEVKRLALNMDQVNQYDPPENPAKLTDSRANAYIAQFGDSSWELDALEPRVLSEIVTRAVTTVRDEGAWAEAVAQEERERAVLKAIADQYEKVKKHLKLNGNGAHP